MDRNLRNADHDLQISFLKAKRRFEKSVFGKRYNIQVIGVLRTDEEQKQIWWHSREMIEEKIVQKKGIKHITYKDGVIDKSKHQANKYKKSEAIDFAPVNRKTGEIDWLKIVPFYVFGRMCEDEGLRWGGRWVNFRDYGHIETK